MNYQRLSKFKKDELSLAGKKLCLSCFQEKFLVKFPKSFANCKKYMDICYECNPSYTEKKYVERLKKNLMITHQKRATYPEKYREIGRLSMQKRRKTGKVREYYRNNPNARISNSMRARLGNYLKRLDIHKNDSTFRLIGCTPEILKNHLERQFKFGMNWNNYGINGWHIDHIVPLSSFDLNDQEQLARACNFKNLQPLWCHENWSKNDKIYALLEKT